MKKFKAVCIKTGKMKVGGITTKKGSIFCVKGKTYEVEEYSPPSDLIMKAVEGEMSHYEVISELSKHPGTLPHGMDEEFFNEYFKKMKGEK